MSAAAVLAADGSGRWVSPLSGHRFDSGRLVRAAEAEAITSLGVDNLRRLACHDPVAPGWIVVRRLTRPTEIVNAGLYSPVTAHRRRAMLDTVAVLLTRCAATRRTFWAWSAQEWISLLGHTQAEFRGAAAPWVGDEVRPYLAAHAFLLGGFRDFHELGRFQRLTRARQVFGADRVEADRACPHRTLEMGLQARRDARPTAADRAEPGAAAQRQPAPRGRDYRGLRPCPRGADSGWRTGERPVRPAARDR